MTITTLLVYRKFAHLPPALLNQSLYLSPVIFCLFQSFIDKFISVKAHFNVYLLL